MLTNLFIVCSLALIASVAYAMSAPANKWLGVGSGSRAGSRVINSILDSRYNCNKRASRALELLMAGIDTPSKPIAPRLIIAGAPAAGKGTQCEIIKQELGVVHLSTGDMLRAAVKDKTKLGMKAKEYMDSGQLVPDDLIINVVVERLKQPDCQRQGWLLDGFPRTRTQADALKEFGIEADAFILLDVPQEVLVERVTGRRTDPETGKIYHMTFSPPSDPEVTKRLVQRSDDTEEKIVVRYQEFCSHVDSVKECYTDRTVWVDGSISPEQVSQVIMGSLSELVTEGDSLSHVGTQGGSGDGRPEIVSGSDSSYSHAYAGHSSSSSSSSSSSALCMTKTEAVADDDVIAVKKQANRRVHIHSLGMRQLTARSPVKYSRFAA